MRETKLKVLHQGEVKLCHDTGYSVVGNDEAVFTVSNLKHLSPFTQDHYERQAHA